MIKIKREREKKTEMDRQRESQRNTNTYRQTDKLAIIQTEKTNKQTKHKDKQISQSHITENENMCVWIKQETKGKKRKKKQTPEKNTSPKKIQCAGRGCDVGVGKKGERKEKKGHE